MSSIGTGYDLTCLEFSPDGRIFQIEYATKAVDRSGTALALRCRDGVVFAVEQTIESPLYETSTGRRIFNVDYHIGMCSAGLVADARALADFAKNEAKYHRDTQGQQMPSELLAKQVAAYMHAYTQYSNGRPFGCYVIFGAWDDSGPNEKKSYLYQCEPSGTYYGYRACAVGKERQKAKTELEKLSLENLNCRQAVIEAAKIIYKCHDEAKDKEFVLDLSWVGEPSKGRHMRVPKDVWEEANKAGQEAVETAND